MNPGPSPTPPRPLAGWVALSCLIASVGGTLIARRAHAADTLYVDNTNCPGGSGTTPETAFCRVDSALNSFIGGTNKVIALMGQGKPYIEQIKVSPPDSGSVTQPLVLFARGAVTVEGADTTSGWTPRPADSASIVILWAAPVLAAPSFACRQVIMRHSITNVDRRYPELDTVLTALPVGKSHYDAGKDTAFVNFDEPSRNYAGALGYLCVRKPIRVLASNVVIDGFTVSRAQFDGITVGDSAVIGDPTYTRGVSIRNCIVQESGLSGIVFARALRSNVRNNICRWNTKQGIFLKSAMVESCTVVGNTCYSNDDQSTVHSGTNGIRIGNFTGPTSGNHVVEGNRTYDNEDTGIDVQYSNNNLLRYNQSWLNRDHGFDHLKSSGTRHIGDLAYANERSGVSVEKDAPSTTLRNCVMSDNGRAVNRQDYELEVIGTARATFAADYNVIWRPSRPSSTCGDWNETQDTILVAWRTSDNQSIECQPRCTMDSTCFGTIPGFATATGNDAHSKGGEVKFVSGGIGDFRAKTSSSTVDAADTTVAGWRTTDILGWKRFDCRVTANTGTPAGTFGDVGPYEHDDGGPTIQVENVGCTSLKVKWIARGASADTLPVPAKYEVFQDGVEVREDTSPQNPGSWENETFSGLEQGHAYEYFVRTTDADGEIAESNKAYNTPCCSPPCEVERPGGGSRAVVADEEADYPLGLEHAGANPSSGIGTVSWSIPRAQEGARYDLSLFDLAGRQVATIAQGTAKAGKFAQEMVSHGEHARLRNGVVFLRLRVGAQVVTRTVVLLR